MAEPNFKKKGKLRIRIFSRGALIRLGILAAFLAFAGLWGYVKMIKMPGKSYTGPLPVLTKEQELLKAELAETVEVLAGQIGERNVWSYQNLARAADFVESRLAAAGYQVRRYGYQAEGKECFNIEAELGGGKSPDEIVIVGAHYDTVFGSPGANDNASGVAAGLALAQRFSGKDVSRTLRFVFFVNEEQPFFQTDQMGSLVYAKRCKAKGERIVGMLSLETLGYYTDEPSSQNYPSLLNLFYPAKGNFVAFVANFSSRKFLYAAISTFRQYCKFPSEGAALPQNIDGIGWSDHWAFWQEGFPAVMVTDTAPFRYPQYHTNRDKPERIDYDKLARVVSGLNRVIADMVE